MSERIWIKVVLCGLSLSLTVAVVSQPPLQGAEIRTGVRLPAEQQEELHAALLRVKHRLDNARELLKAGQPFQAEIVARSAFEITPVNADIDRFVAEALIRQRNFAEAIEVFNGMKPTILSPRDKCRVGLLYAELGNFEASRELWSQLADPGSASLIHGKSESLTSIPKPTDIESLRAAWRFFIGMLEDGKRDDFAMHYYKQAHALIPTNALLNLNIAWLYMREDQTKEAIRHFEIASANGEGSIKSRAEAGLRKAKAVGSQLALDGKS